MSSKVNYQSFSDEELAMNGHHFVPNTSSSSPEQSLNDSLNQSDSELLNTEAQAPVYHQQQQPMISAYDYSNSTVPTMQGSPYYHVAYQTPYTPQQQTTTAGIYQPYAYVYDPTLGAYTLNTYSPSSNASVNSQQQTPQSPQQQTNGLLASYQTPRQAQHQLYISPMNEPAANTTPSSSNTEQSLQSNTNSPSSYQYLVYPTANPYLTPQAYQSPYMMYQPALAPQQQQTPTSIQSVPMAQPQAQQTRYNKSKANRNNRYNKYQNNKNMTSVESTPQFPSYTPSPTVQTMYQSNSASPLTCSEDCQDQTEQQQQAAFDAINLQSYYDYVNAGITTYGEEFDDEEQNVQDGEQENEQLACYVCRGRRMCFCYFLKVRYYKFPSFLDLVDHQYKKWRSNMIKAKKSN